MYFPIFTRVCAGVLVCVRADVPLSRCAFMALRKWEGEYHPGKEMDSWGVQVKLALPGKGLKGGGVRKSRVSHRCVVSWLPLFLHLPKNLCRWGGPPELTRQYEGIIVDFVCYSNSSGVRENVLICYKCILKYYRKRVWYIEFALIYSSKHKYIDK